MSDSCNNQTFHPFPVCLGNGHCDELSNKCICNDGWTFYADFANVNGSDCVIHVTTLVTLWSIAAVISTISSLVTLYCVLFQLNLYRLHLAKDPASGGGGNIFRIMFKYFIDPVRLFPFQFLCANVWSVAVSISRASHPETTGFGIDAPTTVLNGLLGLTYLLAGMNFNYVILKFLQGTASSMTGEARENMERDISIIFNSYPLLKLLLWMVNIEHIASLGYPQHSLVFGRVYVLSLMAWIIVFLTLLVTKALYPMKIELGKHIITLKTGKLGGAAADSLEVILKKITSVLLFIVQVLLFVFTAWLIFLIFPQIARAHVYLFPLLVSNASVVALLMSISVTNNNNKKTQSEIKVQDTLSNKSNQIKQLSHENEPATDGSSTDKHGVSAVAAPAV